MTITVHSATGDVLKTLSRSYGVNVFMQTPAADFATMALGANEYLSIEVTAGRAIVYGSWIDNLTNDPSMQLARRY